MQRAGIQRVCILTHYLEERIFDYVGDGSKWDLIVSFAHQNEMRGSGDALLSVPREWIRDETFMVVAIDYLLEADVLFDLVEAHKQYEADISMSLKECPSEELVSRSSVEVDPAWRVKRIVEKPAPGQVMSPYAADT